MFSAIWVLDSETLSISACINLTANLKNTFHNSLTETGIWLFT